MVVDNPVIVYDVDRLCYAAGYAAEHKQPDGTTEVEPLSHVLQTVKQSLNKTLRDLKAEDGDRGWWLFLSGPGNFRFDVATIRPYKGNRTQPKPFHYEAIRKYLVEQWASEVTFGYEADDAVCMKMYEEGPGAICCGVDKDFLQIPGLHYNPVKEEWKQISEREAWMAYWTQVLTGDSIDAIVGCPKIGKVKAAKILDGARSEQDAYRRCLEAYKVAYDKGCPTYTGGLLSAQEALEENCLLLHLLQNEEDKWQNRIQ